MTPTLLALRAENHAQATLPQVPLPQVQEPADQTMMPLARRKVVPTAHPPLDLPECHTTKCPDIRTLLTQVTQCYHQVNMKVTTRTTTQSTPGKANLIRRIHHPLDLHPEPCIHLTTSHTRRTRRRNILPYHRVSLRENKNIKNQGKSRSFRVADVFRTPKSNPN